MSNKGGSLKKLQGSLKSLASLNRSGGPGDNLSFFSHIFSLNFVKGSLKDHTRSPSADKKKPIVPKDHQFFSPITAKKQLMGSGSGFLRSPVLDAYGSNNTVKTPSSTKRVEMKSSFLQMNLNTNLNHLGGSHQLMKKSIVDEGASLKDLIKKAVGQNNTTPQKTMDQFNTKIPLGTPLNTPLSPHQTKQMLNKERDRKSRFSVGTNPLDALKAAAGEQIHREGRHEMTSIPEETQPKLAKTRAKSLKMLKDLQKAEDTPAVVNVFTSLADT